jgi:hypothetical protein
MKTLLELTVLFIFLIVFSGCAMQPPSHWQDASPDIETPESEALAQEAQQLFEVATDRESLLSSIAAFEKVLVKNPGDYSTLTVLSNQYILLGTAYTGQRGEKSHHFNQAMRYAELAMYSNVTFKQRVSTGTPLWEATEVLEKAQVEAMFFWVTALQYDFKEGMNLVARIVNVRWMGYGLTFLDRIEQVAPEFGGGGVEFAKVICYYVLPKSMGGSKSMGDDYMIRSLARADGWLLPRWARGKYYYVVKGEPDKARADLEWVASQNLEYFNDPTAWKVHFQANAMELLK